MKILYTLTTPKTQDAIFHSAINYQRQLSNYLEDIRISVFSFIRLIQFDLFKFKVNNQDIISQNRLVLKVPHTN